MVAFLQLPVLELIFSATWVVLILALKINVLKEMTFNLTTTVGCMSLTNRKLKSLELLHEWWEKCKIAASSATVPPTVQKIMFATTPTHYVSRFLGEEFKPESLNLTVKHLLKIMIWCCMARSEVGHCRWNCQCDQMHWYTAEVRRAISIALFQKAYPFCLKDDNEPCHLAKLVSNWKCQNNTRTLTSLAQ